MSPKQYLINELNTNKHLKPRTRKHYQNLLNKPGYAEKHKVKMQISEEEHLLHVINNPKESGKPWYPGWERLYKRNIKTVRDNLDLVMNADPLEITWYD